MKSKLLFIIMICVFSFSALGSIEINDSRFDISNNTLINTTSLSIGDYSLKITVNNTLGEVSEFIFFLELKDTTSPIIYNITYIPDLSYYTEDDKLVYFNINDSSNISSAILELNNQNYDAVNLSYFNLTAINSGDHYYTIYARDDESNLGVYLDSLLLSKNSVYEFDFEINTVSANSYTLRPSTNYVINISIPDYSKTFDVVLNNLGNDNSTIIASDVSNYSNSSFSISSTGSYELELTSDSDDNFEELITTISLTVSNPSSSSSSSSSSSGGGGGGGSYRSKKAVVEEECLEAWSCDKWSLCDLCDDNNCNSNTGEQLRKCSLVTSCDTQKSKPVEKRYCDLGKINPILLQKEICKELYDCSGWSECSESTQTRTCTQTTDCSTDILKPLGVKECGIKLVNTYFDEILNKNIVDFESIDNSIKESPINKNDIISFKLANNNYQLIIKDSNEDMLIASITNLDVEVKLKDSNHYYLDLNNDKSIDVKITYIFDEVGNIIIESGNKQIIVQKPEDFIEEEVVSFSKKTKVSLYVILIILFVLAVLIIYFINKKGILNKVSSLKKIDKVVKKPIKIKKSK